MADLQNEYHQIPVDDKSLVPMTSRCWLEVSLMLICGSALRLAATIDWLNIFTGRHWQEKVSDTSASTTGPARATSELMSFSVLDTLDGQYWLDIIESSPTQEFKVLVERPVSENQPADVEVLAMGEPRCRLVLRVADSNDPVTIEVGETKDKGAKLDTAIWPASVAAAAWVARMGEAALTGDVLELGSGTGVFGIAAGVMAAAVARKNGVRCTLMLSEISDMYVCSLRDTITCNAPVLNGLASANARVLSWGVATQNGFVPETQYDHVVASDCVYLLEHVVLLVGAIVGYLKEGGSAYLVVPCNRIGLREVIEALSRHGKVVQVRAVLTHRMEELDLTPSNVSMELIVFRKAAGTLISGS
eukprot:gnl/MRDRNA2_/MRDRNA2_78282_c0_seq1.p1 gnl/MRDRNA2_/MRDRNA2_78282_c0~~gnl/MRDRNA2_/MRDRNA2_78282_c0_seq1.p1  ORF type:complete len:361 (+),score=51.75 gnl/MRDRNA2_/MRDRNA2_78282_c0_seq1:85-1167(+)